MKLGALADQMYSYCQNFPNMRNSTVIVTVDVSELPSADESGLVDLEVTGFFPGDHGGSSREPSVIATGKS